MTFLPIVERELRVAARKKGTYLTRVGVGMGAMVLGAVAGLATVVNPSLRFGAVFFQTLSGVAMLYCLGAGRFLTADCLSAEKREDTMGLLFLTDLKGYDVVLGKLAATSLNGLYGLLAVLPVLAITLVTGGIALGEICRAALVLLDTFLFSLAVGIFASSLTREFRSAMALNFYVLLGLAGLPPALAGLWRLIFPAVQRGGWRVCLLPCPVYTLVLAFDAPYKVASRRNSGLRRRSSWRCRGLLVALACRIAPRSWQARPLGAAEDSVSRREAASRGRGALPFGNRLLDQNAYYWLAARPWWKARAGRGCVIGRGAVLAGVSGYSLSAGWMNTTCLPVALVLNGAFKCWITLEAGQTLAEDMRKAGRLNCCWPRRWRPREIVRGQLLALRRLFLQPLLVVAGMESVPVHGGADGRAAPCPESFRGAVYCLAFGRRPF
jgi:hypothetical protein